MSRSICVEVSMLSLCSIAKSDIRDESCHDYYKSNAFDYIDFNGTHTELKSLESHDFPMLRLCSIIKSDIRGQTCHDHCVSNAFDRINFN